MENVLRQELVKEESALSTNQNSNSWKRYIGLSSTTLEEKHRQACVKELHRVFLARQQLDQSLKNNLTVKLSSLIAFLISIFV